MSEPILLPPSVDIAALHDAIGVKIRAGFTEQAVKQVACYVRQGKKIPSPSVLFELDFIEPDEDTNGDVGTDQYNGKLTFSAYVIVGWDEPDAEGKIDTEASAKLLVRLLASKVVGRVNKERFGQNVSPSKVVYCGPDSFQKATDSYETWRVTWEQSGLIGDSAWDFAGVVPSQVFIGFAPNVGPAHVGDYIQVVPNA